MSSHHGNANYTRIQAHGTASAFEPGFINQAATVGPPHGPAETGSPFKVLDTTVDLRGASTGDIFLIGQIPPGCLVTAVSFNSNDTLGPGNILTFGLSEPGEFYEIEDFAPTVVPGQPGVEPNGGQVIAANASVTAGPLPAIRLSTASPNPIVLPASVSVKVVYICP